MAPPPYLATGFPVPPPRIAPPPPPVDAPMSAPAVSVQETARAVTTAEGTKAEKAYVLELKMVRTGPGGKVQQEMAPRVTVLEGQAAVVHVGKCLALKCGSIDDLIDQVNYVPAEDQVRLGNLVRVKVTGLEKDRVQVDLIVRRNEVEKASKTSIEVVGSSLRSIRKVQLGKVVKLVLDKNDQGTARTRIEFKVTADKN
jgi:hypothetical protein